MPHPVQSFCLCTGSARVPAKLPTICQPTSSPMPTALMVRVTVKLVLEATEHCLHVDNVAGLREAVEDLSYSGPDGILS